jgi:hypothetical protein
MTWTPADIRAARQAPLAPILQRLGHKLHPTGGGNFRLHLPQLATESAKEILIKENYWRRPDDGAAGNTIDFFVKIQGLTFKHAMTIIAQPESNNPKNTDAHQLKTEPAHR